MRHTYMDVLAMCLCRAMQHLNHAVTIVGRSLALHETLPDLN